MNVNKLALGFLNHASVTDRIVSIREIAGGWGNVLTVFQEEYVSILSNNQYAHVIMLIDFDDVEGRRAQFEAKIPSELLNRVFLIGAKVNPEVLRISVGESFESIGRRLAQECVEGRYQLWIHPHLIHNAGDLKRLETVVKPILFDS